MTALLQKPNEEYQHEHLITTVKHSDGVVMIWARLQPQDLETSHWSNHELQSILK